MEPEEKKENETETPEELVVDDPFYDEPYEECGFGD